ncbi:MAG: hypothetical protein EBY18_11455, partial [Alphaproteobacteria bacterium]|nr:hypothetical protein [Alphaproteobacteria bacterium]
MQITVSWLVIHLGHGYGAFQEQGQAGMETGMKRLLVIAALVASPLPALAQANPALIEKGRALFNDASLSASGQVSCATCHPMNGHTDNKTYVGLEVVPDGDPRGRSTPTMWGAGTRQAEWSWAGNIPAIETNIRGIIVNRMKGAEPTTETLEALAAYVKSLPNGPAPFLNPDGTPRNTAQADAKRGYELFADAGRFNPAQAAAVPPSYVLGPGDELAVQINGLVEVAD